MRSDKIAWASRLLVVLTALAASLGGVFNDFVYDDIPIIRDNARLHALADWREIIARPYWPPPFVEQLYRPLASFSLALQYALGGGQPIVFRLVSYALYAMCAIGMLQLASRVVGPRAGLLAALLFAAHPVHVEAVALGVNQGELIVALLGPFMALCYIDARRRGDLRARGIGRRLRFCTRQPLSRRKTGSYCRYCSSPRRLSSANARRSGTALSRRGAALRRSPWLGQGSPSAAALCSMEARLARLSPTRSEGSRCGSACS